MAILENIGGTATVEVDGQFKALRVSERPAEVLAWNSVGVRSGLMTGIAAAGAVASFRNLSANLIAVRRVGLAFTATTGFTAAQEIAFGLRVARGFTTSDTGGTAIALTGSNNKIRTSLATLTSVDARISTTAALGAGVKALDPIDIGIVNGWALAATAGVVIAQNFANLLQHDPGDYPLILGINEGFNVVNLVAFGAVGVGTLSLNFEVAEMVSY